LPASADLLAGAPAAALLARLRAGALPKAVP
jgi:hypothetical protein